MVKHFTKYSLQCRVPVPKDIITWPSHSNLIDWAVKEDEDIIASSCDLSQGWLATDCVPALSIYPCKRIKCRIRILEYLLKVCWKVQHNFPNKGDKNQGDCGTIQVRRNSAKYWEQFKNFFLLFPTFWNY